MRDVLGFAQFLRYRAETGLNDKGRHLAQIISISREAELTDKLIEDLLKLARFYRSAVTETEVKLGQLVLEVQEQMAAEAEGWQVELSSGRSSLC